MKKFTKKLSILFASLAMVMGVGLVSGKAATAKTTVNAASDNELEITITNFTEITNSYTTKFTHKYTMGNNDVTIEAYGVYKNNNGIQMNSGKGTYIKNTTAFQTPISKISLVWTATGKNSPTLYANSSDIASKSSTSLGKMSNTQKTQEINVQEKGEFYYFYFDGTTVTGACYLSKMTITLSEAPKRTLKDTLRLEGETNVQKLYADGEEFNPDGLTVYAQYEESNVEDLDVTNRVVWTPSTLNIGTTSVTGTYSEGDKQATITIDDIEVVSPTEEFIKLVNELPEPDRVTAFDKEKIEAARDAYEKLLNKDDDGVKEALAKLILVEEALAKFVPTLKYTLDTSSDTIASDSGYNKYTSKDSLDTTWTVTCGSKSTDETLWLGVNSNQRSTKLKLSGTSDKVDAIAKALEISTSTVGYFGLIQEDKPMNNIGGITISYGSTTGDSTPAKGYILVSTDDGATYKKIDSHEMSKTDFNDGESHIHTFTKNYDNALFAIIFDDSTGSGATRLHAPKFEFYSYPDSSLAAKYVELWNGLRKDGNICDISGVDGYKTITKESELKDLIAKYDDMDEEVRTIVDEMTDSANVTIKDNIKYFKELLAWRDEHPQNNAADQVSFVTRLTESSNSSTLAIIAGLALITIIGYALISKKRLAD